MPTNPKRTTKPSTTSHPVATSQEHGDADGHGGGPGYVQDHLSREPVGSARREPALAPARPQPVRTRGIDGRRDSGLTPDDARAVQQASLRARRRGLH